METAIQDGVFSQIYGFLYRYFVIPGYNIVNTPVYGITLGLAVFILIIPLIRRLGLKIDRKFISGIIPFIIYGSTTRELVDRGFGIYGGYTTYPENFWLVSPGIYATMFLLTLSVMILGLLTQRYLRIGYYVPMVIIGGGLSAYNLLLIAVNIREPFNLILILTAYIISTMTLAFIVKALGIMFLQKEGNMHIISAHLLDASATYVGVGFLGYSEQHVVPSFLISLFNTPLVMFPLKILVLVPALYFIESGLSGAEDETPRRILKLVVLILGAGPALRDITLTIL